MPKNTIANQLRTFAQSKVKSNFIPQQLPMVKFARDSEMFKAKQEEYLLQRNSQIEASGKSIFDDTVNAMFTFSSKTQSVTKPPDLPRSHQTPL